MTLLRELVDASGQVAATSSRSNASAASRRTSILPAPARRSCATASITCRIPHSIVKITDPVPPLVFGP